MAKLWQTGTAWNNGRPLDRQVLRASMQYAHPDDPVAHRGRGRAAFLLDRRNQSYSAIDGLGPLAAVYRPARSPSQHHLHPPAPHQAAVTRSCRPTPGRLRARAGSPASALGAVVTLVNTPARQLRLRQPEQILLPVPGPGG